VNNPPAPSSLKMLYEVIEHPPFDLGALQLSVYDSLVTADRIGGLKP